MTLLIRKKSGSTTVEAAIMMPLIILCLAAFIFMGLLLYQRSLLQATADKAAEEGAAIWKNSGALYWRIIDAEKSGKLQETEKYADTILEQGKLLNAESKKITAVIRDYILYKRLEVSVEVSYRIPAGRFLRLFGADECLSIKVASYSVIDDPAELIRNTDFLIDMEKELEDKYPEIKDLGEKVRGTIGEIKEKINGFLD